MEPVILIIHFIMFLGLIFLIKFFVSLCIESVRTREWEAVIVLGLMVCVFSGGTIKLGCMLINQCFLV